MHDADARHLYVDVAEPLAERALSASAATGDEDRRDLRRATRASIRRVFRAQAPTSAARIDRRGRGAARAASCAPATGSWSASRTAARPSAPATTSTASTPASSASVGARPSAARAVRRGAAQRRLRLARAAARGDPVPPARPPPPRRRAGAVRAGGWRRFADLRVGDYVVHEDHGIARFAGFETKTARRGHPRLPRARVPRRGQGLRAHRPAREDHPLRRRRRRAAAALGARLEALGRGQGARPPRRPRPRRRAAQPLRRAPGPPRPRLRARRRVAARARALVPLPRDRRPDRRDRGGQGATWSRSGRWTG